jgi:hypothetical protein
MKKKYEYFLNAIHYCLWLFDIKFGDFMGEIVDALLSPIPKYLFTKEYKKKCDDRLLKVQKIHDKLFYDKESGYHIGWANHWFGFFYSGYPGFLSFVLLGITDGIFGDVNQIITIVIIALPIGLCYIPAYRAVFSKDRYLKYFKQFEKKDASWYKKWKWITIAFCVGSILFAIGGMYAMWGVSLFFREGTN